uniref:FAS1 domain-containing protein n=1 Tax=Populus trichocarpa TaxID=3694 RepID=B9HD36_POPTR
MTDIRSQNFFGLIFFLPIDQELTRHSMSPDHLEDFLLSHSIPMPLTFSGLNHFPTGTMVPSGLENQLIEIKNRGKADFSVNNAQVIKPNLCVNYTIKCHGIDSVIKFENDYSVNNKLDELP